MMTSSQQAIYFICFKSLFFYYMILKNNFWNNFDILFAVQISLLLSSRLQFQIWFE